MWFIAWLLLLPHLVFAQNPEERKWMAHATELFGQKEYAGAIDCYKAALEENPDSVAAYQGLGLAHVQLKEYDKAFDAFEEALFINPDYAEAHYGMGIVCPLAKRDKKRAIAHFQTYLRLVPNASDAGKVRGWIQQLTMEGTVHRDEAMVSYYNQGVDASNRGDYEQAIDFYTQAIARNTHDAANHHALGLAYVRLGRTREAAAEFEETLKINTRHVESHYDLGVVYPLLSEFDKAIFHYEQYLKMQPNAPDTAQVRAWIVRLKGMAEDKETVEEKMERLR